MALWISWMILREFPSHISRDTTLWLFPRVRDPGTVVPSPALRAVTRIRSTTVQSLPARAGPGT